MNADGFLPNSEPSLRNLGFKDLSSALLKPALIMRQCRQRARMPDLLRDPCRGMLLGDLKHSSRSLVRGW